MRYQVLCIAILTSLSSAGDSHDCVLRIENPLNGSVFEADSRIQVQFSLRAATQTVANRARENAHIRIRLDEGQFVHTATFEAAASEGILLNSLAHGYHDIQLRLQTNASGSSDAFCKQSSSYASFFVGSRHYQPVASGAASDNSSNFEFMARADDTIGVYYSIHTLELRARALQLHRLGYHGQARHAMKISEELLPEHHGRFNPHSGHTPNAHPIVVTACDLHDRHTKFISFRTPAYGLTSQRTEFIGMVAVAYTLNRTLVLPRFDSDLVFPNLSRPPSLPFREVFSLPHFRAALAGVVCMAETEEVEQALRAQHATHGMGQAEYEDEGEDEGEEDGAPVAVPHGMEMPLQWYAQRYSHGSATGLEQRTTSEASASEATTSEASTSEASASEASTSEASTSEASTSEASTSEASNSEASTSEASTSEASALPMQDQRMLLHRARHHRWLHFVRPPQIRFRHNAVDLLDCPSLHRRIDAALRHARKVSDAAAKVVKGLLARSHGGAWLAAHMRVERDWLDYCRRQELRFGGGRGGGLSSGRTGDDVRDSENGGGGGGGGKAPRKAQRFCVGAAEIIARVDAHPSTRAPAVVFVATGDVGMLRPADRKMVVMGWSNDEGRRAYRTADFAPEVANWPYTLRSAVDFEVCSQASMFVGNSWSGFSQQVSKRMAAADRPSYIYNIDTDTGSPLHTCSGTDGQSREGKCTSEQRVVERTDRGLCFEPHDATMLPAS